MDPTVSNVLGQHQSAPGLMALPMDVSGMMPDGMETAQHVNQEGGQVEDAGGAVEQDGEVMEQQAGDVEMLTSGLLLHEMSQFYQQIILPRAKDIEEEISSMMYEAHASTAQGQAEKQAIDNELQRLSHLITNFQQNIAKFLPSLGF